MAIILGQDVSKYQGDINFDVYKNNTNFVIVKSTEGTGFTDPKFIRNQSEARRVGLSLGYYHFARPDLGNSPESECDWYLSVCGGPREGEVFTLDYEPPNQKQSDVDWCKRFLDRLQSKIGVKALIYLNQSQVKQFNWQSVIDGGYGLWIAAYSYDPNNNTFEKGKWPFAAMQQWTNRQQVPGIPALVDGNVFFGDLATFKKYGFKPSIPTPQPPSDCQKKLDEATIKIKQLENDKDTLDKEKREWESKYSQLREAVVQLCRSNGIQVIL